MYLRPQIPMPENLLVFDAGLIISVSDIILSYEVLACERPLRVFAFESDESVFNSVLSFEKSSIGEK